MSASPWYAGGLRFRCTQCGNCCRNHGDYAYVYVDEREVEAISRHLGLGREEFLESYCTEVDGWTTLRMDQPACPFLRRDQTCSIYPVRPRQCATWPFWPENLEREVWDGPVRDCCPGIGHGPLHSLEDIRRLARET